MSPVFVGKRRRKHSPFGREIAMLRDGEPLWHVLRSFLGRCRDAQAHADRWWAMLQAAYDDDDARRRVVETFLRMWDGGARLNPRTKQYRVVDAAGFSGHRHMEPEPVVDEHGRPVLVTNPRTGKLEPKIRRPHWPAKDGKGGVGKLPAAVGVAPRTIDHYKRVMRAGGVLASQRTTKNMADAVVPAGGKHWGYAHYWMPHKPTAEMLRRLQGYCPPRYPPKKRQAPDASHPGLGPMHVVASEPGGSSLN